MNTIRFQVISLVFIGCLLFTEQVVAQQFTRADSLRGTLSPLRSSYDINYYHLDIRVDIDNKFIDGSNTFRFTATDDIQRLQFDLFENLSIEKVIWHGNELSFDREFNAVFIDFPDPIKKGSSDEFTVYYKGHPTIAKRAPWEGGFTFAHDREGRPWVGVSCQGFGASSWWPVKDHQADEVDSMLISVSVPEGLMNVSNGRLRSTEVLDNGYTRYNWFISYPINNYNVTLNIAAYEHFSDQYQGENGLLTLDYYVLKENLGKAKKQFGRNVSPMLKAFENWFGPYPFYRDGFKLVEAPYLGMEHQSAIAYGNNYLNGYRGKDLSGTGLGLKWDYIIVHEAAHEWFGNNITSKDIADMWIHEAFTMYAEGLFLESLAGKKAGADYIKGVGRNIRNDAPIIGPYGVNKEGSSDMYYKGARLVHIIRTIIDDDDQWRAILRGLNKEFGLKTTTTEEVVAYINRMSGKDLSKIFDQYLRYAAIPILEYKTSGDETSYRWKADVPDFDMSLRISDGKGYQWIRPSTDKWQKIKLQEAFNPDTDNFYIGLKEL
jgi:aminopeptidase N